MAYKRTIYLVNPAFQLKTSFFITIVAFLACLPYPLIMYRMIDNVMTKLITGEKFPSIQELSIAYDENKVKLLGVFIVCQLIVGLLVFIACIFQGHRIAGPMYKLQQYFKKIKDGFVPPTLTFRKGDHFKEIAKDFNESFLIILKNHENDIGFINESVEFLNKISPKMIGEDQKRLTEISSKLIQIQNKFKIT